MYNKPFLQITTTTANDNNTLFFCPCVERFHVCIKLNMSSSFSFFVSSIVDIL